RSNERYQVEALGPRRSPAMPLSGAWGQARRVACYAELPRINLIGTSVNTPVRKKRVSATG
ncbi:MAG: hypothetical protein ACRDN7_00935, partial [Rubrobacter sp.]